MAIFVKIGPEEYNIDIDYDNANALPQLSYFMISLCDIICQWLGKVGGFLSVLRFPPTIKLTATI